MYANFNNNVLPSNFLWVMDSTETRVFTYYTVCNQYLESLAVC